MPFQVKDTERLRIEADRIASILTLRSIHSNPDGSARVWDEADFIAHLEGLGIVYSPTELAPLRAELLTRGVIE